MTVQEAKRLKRDISDVLNPVKERDGLIIMAYTFDGARGLYMLAGLAINVIYNDGNFDVNEEIGNWKTKDYFAAKGSLDAMNDWKNDNSGNQEGVR